jgi:chromate transporter
MLLYQEAVVKERQWLSEEEFFEIVTVAQLLPGPNLVNLSVYLSNRLFHPWAALFSVIALTLPGAFLGVFFVAMIDTSNPILARIFQGFSFGSIVLFLVFLTRMVRNIKKDSAGTYRAWLRPALALAIAGASFAGVPLLPLLGGGILFALLVEFLWR